MQKQTHWKPSDKSYPKLMTSLEAEKLSNSLDARENLLIPISKVLHTTERPGKNKFKI